MQPLALERALVFAANLCGVGLPDRPVLPLVKSVMRAAKEKGKELLEYHAIPRLYLDPHSLQMLENTDSL